MSLTKLSIAELINGYNTKQFLPSEVVKSYIANIENNSKLNAFITTNFEEAITQAKIADSKISSGEIGELTGIPIANKDLFCTKGVRTTCASKMLENFVPEYESTVTQKLLDAGAISLGKLNMDEFAMGSTNITSYFGPVINP
jgi:aspartyl-tRNA(Asn)/glutamyl-tRNA(Gln) amidotransferase subunit A